MTTPKFYRKNKITDSTTFTCTSISAGTETLLYDRKRTSKCFSIGSNDSTDEDIEIDFGGAVLVDAIWVDNHNIKSGSIQYWNGSAYTAFSTPATWSANANVTSFFEFNQVSTSKIRVRATTTMVANAQKFTGEIAVLELIGTPDAGPSEVHVALSEDSRIHRLANGGSVYVLFGQKAQINITFSDALESDMSLFSTLKNLADPFYVYLSGGDQTLTELGFRPQDLYLVNYSNPFETTLHSAVLGIGEEIALELLEA
jgi:hypothetical protein